VFGVGVLHQSSVSLTTDSNVKTIYVSTQLVETNNVKTSVWHGEKVVKIIVAVTMFR
jgi:hypothetical protein